MKATLNWLSRMLHVTAATFAFVAVATCVRTDIFQWEYVNPADPSQGKQQSTTLAPLVVFAPAVRLDIFQ